MLASRYQAHRGLSPLAIMEAGFRQELQARGVAEAVIIHLDGEGITTLSLLANFFDDRAQIGPQLIQKVQGLPKPQQQKAILCELWREADSLESLRLSRRVQGLDESDTVDQPLASHIVESLELKFRQIYGFPLSSRERLCDAQLGRLKRELDKKSFTLFDLSKLRTAREQTRTTPSKRTKLTEDLSITLTKSTGSRDITSVPMYLALLEVLMVGGYALIGSFCPGHLQGPAMWCSMQTCRAYITYIRNKVCPMGEPKFSVSAVKQADEEVRAFWAESLRSGLSFDEAFVQTEAKMHVCFLFTTRRDAAEVQSEVKDGGKRDHKRRSHSSSSERVPLKRRKRSASPVKGPKVAATTKNGRAICRLWNLGHGCKGDKCKHDRAHICNYVMKGGKTCGQNHKRVDNH